MTAVKTMFFQIGGVAQYAGYAVQKMYKCIKCSCYMGLSNRTLKNWWLIICLIIISHIKGSCFATKNVCNPPVWTKIKQPWLWKNGGRGLKISQSWWIWSHRSPRAPQTCLALARCGPWVHWAMKHRKKAEWSSIPEWNSLLKSYEKWVM